MPQTREEKRGREMRKTCLELPRVQGTRMTLLSTSIKEEREAKVASAKVKPGSTETWLCREASLKSQ